MEILAGDWWTSGSFWQFVITIVAGVAVGALGAWATLRSSNPKRELNWWVRSNTPLISLPQFSAGDGELTVGFRGVSLSSPRIVELAIANQGRRDITAAMFHGDESMRFDFDADVCTILDVSTTPSGTVRPSLDTGAWTHVAFDTSAESWLDLKPSLLSRGQVVTVTVLVDGDEKPVRCSSAPLVDVKVVSEPPGAQSRALVGALSGGGVAVGPFRIQI